jgi:hypothetical protein
VFDYRLDDQGSIPGRAKGLFLWPLYLLSNGYRGSFTRGGKAQPWRDADHSPHLLPGSITRRYSLPFVACMTWRYSFTFLLYAIEGYLDLLLYFFPSEITWRSHELMRCDTSITYNTTMARNVDIMSDIFSEESELQYYAQVLPHNNNPTCLK